MTDLILAVFSSRQVQRNTEDTLTQEIQRLTLSLHYLEVQAVNGHLSSRL